ncbi:MAG: type II toxin-antitoxin system VapC family toxin [Thermodesulfovibrionales bacterium]|jgi:ribonuclease VapC|nr:type II toxin-antitoxin system VapC family toxin [Thermodesulfovibrionales bacterium]
MKKGPFIFDSYALLKLFQKEDGYEKIASLLAEIRKTGTDKYINAINLGEIIYSTKREFGDQKKIEVLANIERLNFSILPIPNSLIFQAAEYKAQYSISYADCFTLASAVEHKAVIVTGDPEFKKVQHLANIVWV